MADELLKLFRDRVEVLHLDNHLLVVRKPAGMLSQEDSTGDPDLLSLGKAFIRAEFQKPGQVFLGLVHRLDRPVGGVMVFARTSKAAARLSQQIRERSIRKEYLAVVEGVAPEYGHLRDLLAKDSDQRRTRVLRPGRDTQTGTKTSTDRAGWFGELEEGGKVHGSDAQSREEGREAELRFERLAVRIGEGSGAGSKAGGGAGSGAGSGGSAGASSLLSVDLKTGRSHQIRAQLSHAGHPIAGDRKYGSRRQVDLGLFASAIGFRHPTREEWLTFSAKPPNAPPWIDFPEAFRPLSPDRDR